MVVRRLISPEIMVLLCLFGVGSGRGYIVLRRLIHELVGLGFLAVVLLDGIEELF